MHRVGRTARAGRSGKSITLVTQYDIEWYQRIEAALNKKLDEFKVNKDEVMVIAERVSEAVRVAMMDLRDEQMRAKGGKRGREDADDNDKAAAKGPKGKSSKKMRR